MKINGTRIGLVITILLAAAYLVTLVTGHFGWYTFVLPVAIYALGTIVSMSECPQCNKPIGHEVKKESPIFIAVSIPTLTCRHCGYRC